VSLKRVLATSILAVLPLTSFAECHVDVESYESKSAFYLKGFYNAGIVGSHEFENGGNGYVAANTTGPIQGSITDKYDPEYKFNAVGGGLAVGYSLSGMRVELEGILSGKFEPKEDKDMTFYADVNIPANLANATNNLDQITTAAGQFKNDGFSYMAGMLNAYYDFTMSDTIMPYVGIGAGFVQVTFNGDQEVKTYPFALQGKIGTSFKLGKLSDTSIMPYVGYRVLYFMEKEANDDNILTTSTVMRNDASGVEISTPIADAKFEYKMKSSALLHNIEAGFIIPLNA
jgi:opacity protein-like surface antigen